MRLKTSNLLWGFFFIIIGIGFAGNVMNIWNFELFFNGWWTLFIIVPCAISLIQNGFRVSNVGGLGIGLLLLLSSQGFIDGTLIAKLIVPFIFVLIGLSMIFKNLFHSDKSININIHYQGNTEHSAIFSGHRYEVTGEKFLGTTMNAIFGGVELDLRNAIIDEDIVINATAVFGGIDIWVPANVRVKENAVNIFGGIDNKASKSMDPNAPTIYLNSTCMFGGIDVK